MIIQILNKPGFWLVPSSDGKRTYEVHASGSCECKDYLWRRAATYDLCRHGKALKAHLDALKACPSCGGRGAFVPRLTYASGCDPICCSVCGGTGRRDTADPNLLAAADAFRAEQRDAELKALFR